MIKRIGKRFVAGFLTAVLITGSLIGMPSYAEENAPFEETKTEKGFQGENPVSAENYWEVDANGNIKQAEEESGIVEEEDISLYVTTPQVVNFNTKAFGQTTDYTEEETGIAGYTYGPYAADAAYLGKTGSGKVRFMLAGVIGTVNASEVQIVNKSSAKSLSYYYVSNNRLYHKIATNINNATSGSTLDNGPAPSYLKSGVNYYSYDGHYFYTESNFGNMIDDYNNKTRTHSVNPNTPFYNYFQYLPLRSKTSYSESSFSTIVNNKVSSTSKMRDMGDDFVRTQNTYGANAILMAGVAANESTWGTSKIAKTKNNLFGLNAVDSFPGQSANYFASVPQCIKEYGEKWLSKEYLNPQNWKHYGAFLGNKASGMNVKYASDPYWGEKAAAMAWLLDSNGGNKDAYRYTIGIKDTVYPSNTVNVRKESTTSSTAFYKTKKNANCAFLVLDKNPVNKFYKIQSEPVLNSGRTGINSSSGVYDFSNMYAYLSSDYLKIVSDGQEEGVIPTPTPNPKEPAIAVPNEVKNALTYSSHMENLGWDNSVKNGEQSGVTGLNYAMEGFKLQIKGISNLGVKYSAHVSNDGWQNWVQNGQLAGTTGQKKDIEALKIELTGSRSDSYDIHYRVFVEGKGWQKYVSNGEMAGTTGESKQIEAIQIILVEKIKDVSSANLSKSAITYTSNVESLGWMGTSENGEQSGTIDMKKAMSGIKIQINGISGLSVEYSTHIPNVGWQGYVSNGKESNAIGSKKQLEAIKIRLTGSQASQYDIYYRVHSQQYGWLGWAKNGQEAGTQGYGYRMEAIQIVLQKKGGTAPGVVGNSFMRKPTIINYSTHIENVGWQNTVSNGTVSGTEGKKLRMEAIKISLSSQEYTGGVQYSSHVQNIGWQSWKEDGELSGTFGEKLRMEAIKIRLTGEMAQKYDIYYRVHAQQYGWLGWAKNGQEAGTQGYGYRLEAIQIQLVKKGGNSPGVSSNSFVKKPLMVGYSTHIQNYGWQTEKYNGETSGTIGESKRLEALKIALYQKEVSGNIEYNTHVQDYGWLNWAKNGEKAGSEGKSKRLEAIQVRLTGDMQKQYDVYYRVHVQDYGWLNWAKNGEKAGSEGKSKRLEALEIRLVKKGDKVPVGVGKAFIK